MNSKYVDYLNSLKPNAVKNVYGGNSDMQKKLSIVAHLKQKFNISDNEAINAVAEWSKQ